ncbi:hypothetical protein NDU88_003333 [Pleurodeles waltl]|uniref:Uncharacterized protein n=1 Tax=Pleurodeles waltl TaxID=8319 RepID=A0AAV7LLB4_PLEWA|nr:hypothetical protein NDU88_003333 [Pleurodeles waltl]
MEGGGPGVSGASGRVREPCWGAGTERQKEFEGEEGGHAPRAPGGIQAGKESGERWGGPAAPLVYTGAADATSVKAKKAGTPVGSGSGSLDLGVSAREGHSGLRQEQGAEGDPSVPLSLKWPTMLQWSSDEEGGGSEGDRGTEGGGSPISRSGGAPSGFLGAGNQEGELRGWKEGRGEEGVDGVGGCVSGGQWDSSSSLGTPVLSWQEPLDYSEEDPGEQDAARVHWGEGKAGPWAASRIASTGWSRRRSGAADASTGWCGGEGVAPPGAAAQQERHPGPSRRRSKDRGEYSGCVRCGGAGANAVVWEERSEESLEEGELRNSGSEHEWWESGGRGSSNPVRQSLQVRRSGTRRGPSRGQRLGGEARTVQERPPLLSPDLEGWGQMFFPKVIYGDFK